MIYRFFVTPVAAGPWSGALFSNSHMFSNHLFSREYIENTSAAAFGCGAWASGGPPAEASSLHRFKGHAFKEWPRSAKFHCFSHFFFFRPQISFQNHCFRNKNLLWRTARYAIFNSGAFPRSRLLACGLPSLGSWPAASPA